MPDMTIPPNALFDRGATFPLHNTGATARMEEGMPAASRDGGV
jgi:hypothetical protein